MPSTPSRQAGKGAAKGAVKGAAKQEVSQGAGKEGAGRGAGKGPAGRAGRASEGEQPLDRASLTMAMVALRKRLLAHGGCGVRPNSSWCVGVWCDVADRRQWGAHASRMPWEKHRG